MPESGRRAGSPVSVYMCEYNAESPKQDRKRFNSIVMTINIAELGIIYLWSTLYSSLSQNNLTRISLVQSTFQIYRTHMKQIVSCVSLMFRRTVRFYHRQNKNAVSMCAKVLFSATVNNFSIYCTISLNNT